MTDKGSINQRAGAGASRRPGRSALRRHSSALRHGRALRANHTGGLTMDIRGHLRDRHRRRFRPCAANRAMLAERARRSRSSTSTMNGRVTSPKRIGGLALHLRRDIADEACPRLPPPRTSTYGPHPRVCAGVGPAKRIVGRDGPMPLADFARVIEVNLIGHSIAMRLVAADMPRSAAGRRRARRHHLHRVRRRL